ncbi:MAG: hypothetical protein U9Q69_02220 [Nanoarchaeota archaeon]|nr:hypothetical protein [Nanoarchaeota archaeon]
MFDKLKYTKEDLIEMKCFVKYNLYYGQAKHVIRDALLDQGWDEKIVDRAFLEAEKIKIYVPSKPKNPICKKEQKVKVVNSDIPLPPLPH